MSETYRCAKCGCLNAVEFSKSGVGTQDYYKALAKKALAEAERAKAEAERIRWNIVATGGSDF